MVPRSCGHLPSATASHASGVPSRITAHVGQGATSASDGSLGWPGASVVDRLGRHFAPTRYDANRCSTPVVPCDFCDTCSVCSLRIPATSLPSLLGVQEVGGSNPLDTTNVRRYGQAG